MQLKSIHTLTHRNPQMFEDILGFAFWLLWVLPVWKWLAFFKFSSVQLLSPVQVFETPWTAPRQASLFITNSRSSLRLMPIESVMPSNHLILCCPLLLPCSIFPSIKVSSKESTLCIRWPKYWSFSFNISPSNEYSGLISFRTDLNFLNYFCL